LSLIVEFSAQPLPGPILVLLDAATVAHLVETFFGGQGNESRQEEPEFFTPGEINVAKLFSAAALSLMADIWAPVASFSVEIVGTHLSTGVIERVDVGDPVIVSEFSLNVAAIDRSFQIILPHSTVGALLPVFEGQKRDRDAVNDAHWNRALSARVIESIVRVSSAVGHTSMTLGEVAELKAGDIITISNPQNSTLLAGSVPILAGRFGVHDGRYAIEATTWLETKGDSSVATT
jgi:flagellar motor switch protein FliM